MSDEMSDEITDPEGVPIKPHKREWHTPALSFVGTMKDILLGGGKAGSTADADPGANFKGGMG